MTAKPEDLWRASIAQAREDITTWVDQIELMLEEEAEGWTADATDAHLALEEATEYIFEEHAVAVLFAVLADAPRKLYNQEEER